MSGTAKKAAAKSAPKSTTPAHAGEDTVAKEGTSAPTKEAVAEAPVDLPQTPPPDTAPAPEVKTCVVCGGPGAFTTNFPWTPEQTFCRRDTPSQYRRFVQT